MLGPLFALVVAAATPAVIPASASASPVADCNSHGTLTQHYSVGELRTALATMPADIQEYTNCYAVIQRALLSQVSSSRSGGGQTSQSSSGSFLPVPVIVVLGVLGVSAAGFGIVALRRG